MSDNLIAINGHGVSGLLPGDRATFQTHQGRILGATRVNRESLDSGILWAE
ncbi:MAG: hypothetical protein HN530_04915 [Gammaproteobacteria bacterium]|nr:hypothetical protein [Gammaproteobacteria bacterium]